jgi:hypothetical protein
MNALHLAVLGQFTEIIRVLLEAGIAVDAQDVKVIISCSSSSLLLYDSHLLTLSVSPSD